LGRYLALAAADCADTIRAAANFLKVAETTGLADTLSRAVLSGLAEDFAALGLRSDVRLSSRSAIHVLHEDFARTSAASWRSAK